jgi:hypothetical protein
MQAIPNLRSVSVTPWADLDKVAEMLGPRYVYSRKPDPVPISGATPHWERAEADLRRTYEATAARGCPVEVLFRDVYDVGGDRTRLTQWVSLARSVLGT